MGSMSKSEIQPLIPFVLSGCQVMRLLIVRHSVPFLVATLIAPDIVYLGKQIYEDIRYTESHQSAITSPIAGSVI